MKIQMDWQSGFYIATDADTYDGAEDSKWPANCIGCGKTEDEAIKDLEEQLTR
jgi:predicted RNase H-like HicB family nuclease